MNLREIINQENTVLIDVREAYEFASGHAEGAVNFPLTSLPSHVNEIKKMRKTIVVYCRSGMRSSNALGFLKAQGVSDVYNGGGLEDVLYYQKKVA